MAFQYPFNFAAVTWEEYLISKKINNEAFRQAEPERWEVWRSEFEQVHPNSFTSQKLYLINPLRRKYPLKEMPVAQPPSVAPPRPVIKPKFK